MSFWKGAAIGAVAGAAYGVWTAPRPGAETRANLMEKVEDSLFRLTGMEAWRPESELPGEWQATAANPAAWDGDEER